MGTAYWVCSHSLTGHKSAFSDCPKDENTWHVINAPLNLALGKHGERWKEPWLLVVSSSLKAYSPARIVDYYRCRMQIEQGFRDTKATHYGLYLANESRIQSERRANLLLIAALILFTLWIVGIHLKGSEVERHIKVNIVVQSCLIR